LSKASHPAIYAFLYKNGESGYDDDGESGSGNRILNMLEMSGTPDILVVVTRWYGGVHLGNYRFKAITDTAQMAVALLPYQ
jgi:putative IMPACT (imprinted ancient) family translation regulator